MNIAPDDLVAAAFFALHRGLPRQGPGSDATTRRLLALAGPLPERPRVLDVGCGPGPAALLLAAETGGEVTAVDIHQPFLDELDAAALRRGLGNRIRSVNCSMAELPYPDHSFDVIWAEGSACNIGFDTALRSWRRLLAPGGVLVVTECEWTTDTPSPEARAFWDAAYPLRTAQENVAAAHAAGYRVGAVFPQPDSDWWEEYYTLLGERIAAADPTAPGMAQVIAAELAEMDVRRDHGLQFRFTGYVLHPQWSPAGAGPAVESVVPVAWTTRAETAEDAAAIRGVNLAAFPTSAEADLVDALRADPAAWVPGLSIVAQAADGTVVGHALLTRCHVDDVPALALAPCAVLPAHQRQGAGSAAIRAALDAARALGENLVLVVGHAGYYPRFGFSPASRFGIQAPFEVPDEAMMVLALADTCPVPTGTIGYPSAFGI